MQAAQDIDEDYAFKQICEELSEMDQTDIYLALGGQNGEQFEEITFNVVEFCGRLNHNSIPFMFYRICKHYDFYCKMSFTMETCFNMCIEVNKGYPASNPYHNQMHICDSL